TRSAVSVVFSCDTLGRGKAERASRPAIIMPHTFLLILFSVDGGRISGGEILRTASTWANDLSFPEIRTAYSFRAEFARILLLSSPFRRPGPGPRIAACRGRFIQSDSFCPARTTRP